MKYLLIILIPCVLCSCISYKGQLVLSTEYTRRMIKQEKEQEEKTKRQEISAEKRRELWEEKRIERCFEVERRIKDTCKGLQISKTTIGDTQFITCTNLCNAAGEYETTTWRKNLEGCWEESSSHTSEGICPDEDN